jgi:purine-binding chemotaxis protein CheW
LDSTATIPEAPAVQLLLVDIGGALYGLDASAVREIVPMRQATRLPGAPAHVSGLINLRGQIVTVVDLVRLLAARDAGSENGSTVVIESKGRLLGVSVDDVHDVQFVGAPEIGALPREQLGSGLVRGVGHFGDAVVIVLDVHDIARQSLA